MYLTCVFETRRKNNNRLNWKLFIMFKKMISYILVLAFAVAIVPAYAQNSTSQDVCQNFMVETFQLDGETVSVRYQEKDGIITYAEVGNDIIENINNEIFVNGIKVATYSVEISGSTIELAPRTGWFYSETPSSVGDYTDYEGAISRNITLEREIASIAVGTLAAVILVFLHLPTKAAGVAAAVIAGVVGIFSAYATSEQIYSIEETYNHDYLPYNKMTNFTYYYDSANNDEIPNSAETLYAWWG